MDVTGNKLQHQSSTSKKVELQYLRTITKQFSKDQILGTGGFGTVYKGDKEDGEVVAVKKLKNMVGMDDKQFLNEVKHLMDLCHPNIVRLEGYCYHIERELTSYNESYIFVDEVYRLLCFEYLPNGSLDKHLTDESSGLDWHTRYNIIEGICRGLHYLHEGRRGAPILHLDLKPSNILLDKNMVPKIADFGLSRLFGDEKTHTCTMELIGSFGYMPPEYIEKRMVSKESDIFSLGVIIIQIVTGYRKYPDGTTTQEFIEVLEKWRRRLQTTSNYTSLEEECRQVKQCIEVGLKCMETDRKKRPIIREIIEMLDESENMNSCSVRKDGSDVEEQSREVVPSDGLSGQLSKASGRAGRFLSALRWVGLGRCNFGWAGPRPSRRLATPFVTGVPSLGRAELESACEDFSNVIGTLSDCALYKGTLSSGVEIAVVSTSVKSAKEWSDQSEEQFRNKISVLSKVNHKNFMNLLGYCTCKEPFTRMMVFEYAPCGSLFEHLHISEAEHLDWPTRLRIIMGVTYCLEHMNQLDPPVIPTTLCSSSIYLTDDYAYAAKISDIEFWKDDKDAASMQSTNQERSFVYKFGILLLEVISGRLPVSEDVSLFVSWASSYLDGKRPLNRMTDPTLEPSSVPDEDVAALCAIVRLCINRDAQKRPTMAEVARLMKGITSLSSARMHGHGHACQTRDLPFSKK